MSYKSLYVSKYVYFLLDYQQMHNGVQKVYSYSGKKLLNKGL